MVIIDTSIWVHVLRVPGSLERAEVERLLRRREAAIVGVIYVEVVRGARDEEQLSRLQERLEAMSFLEARKSTWALAGRLVFDSYRRGEAISLPDAVIAAHVVEGNHTLYASDNDFQRVPGLRLHEPRT